MKILALGAHPDDIEIFMYGLVYIYKKEGNQVFTMIATDGSKGGSPRDELISKKREKEAIEGLKKLSKPTFLNIPDGELGEEIKVLLELKILADVGLVGFPNAGKSTFISKISSAKPKVGDYPFTTLIPNLGIVKYSEYKSFVMADIPGLISGASDGKGLGSQFLKHIERTKILVFMIDSSSDDINEEYKILKNELKKHNEELSGRKSFLLLTKSDVLKGDIKNIPKNVDYIIISSITNSNLKIAIQKIAQLLER